MKRRNFKPEFKTRVVLEALKEVSTSKDLAKKYKLHPQQITNWKKEFIAGASQVFTKGSKPEKSKEDEEREIFLRTIGELKVENDFLKKKLE